MEKKMTYAAVGVDYDAMDPFKRKAQLAGLKTVNSLKRFGFSEVGWSRGESCYLIDIGEAFLAHVEEGLGTKNLVADAFRGQMRIASAIQGVLGRTCYDQIAQDAVAMIVNDMITLGALPLSVAMHLAVGDSRWFDDEQRCHDLIDGWKKACILVRCVWGGGETPTLKGIITPGTAVLSGSAMGIVKPRERLINPVNIQHGDAIIFLASSGIGANGLTMARKIADNLPEGYLTRLSDGRMYGEVLLDPTHLYVAFIEQCLDLGIDINYAVNITGHGWRKLMRAANPFTYVIEVLPKQLPIFDFIQAQGPVDDLEAYGNLNMGAGFTIYVPQDDVPRIWDMLKEHEMPFEVFYAGHIEKSDEKRVVIEPKGIEFVGATLGVR